MSEQIICKERRGTDCLKWDELSPAFGREGLHAMWVADMDFEVPVCVKDALVQYVDHGVFGYYKIPDSYLDAFIQWQKKYHHYDVKREWVRFAPGVVPAINLWIRTLTEATDSIIVLTPVYYPFLNAIRNNSCRLISCDLINDQGSYSIDFEAFERQIVENDVKMFILSSPHNPVGRVWHREELIRLMEICDLHHVYVISDEIHQDIVFGDSVQYPTASLGKYSRFLISLTAATKTFNLAACQNSFVIVENEELRNRYDALMMKINMTDGNTFGYIAVQAALSKGRPWFEEVKKIIASNDAYVRERLAEELPLVEISPLEGTYLLWMNFAAYLKPEEVTPFMLQHCNLALDFGDWFGGDRFRTFARMNLATSRENVKIGVDAIVENLKGYIAGK